jgi:hypothetical protein
VSQRLPSLSSHQAFEVRFRLPSEDSPMMWKRRVKHVVSGQAQRFESQEQLWTCITRVLTALQNRCSPVRPRTRSHGGGVENQAERRAPMPADLELIVLLPLDGTTRALVYHYVAWCYAINARRPATVCRLASGWSVLVGWQ